MDFHLESLAAGFVDVWGFHDGESAALGRERNWAADAGAGANRSVDDLLRALVDDAVVIGLELNTDGETRTLSFFRFWHVALSSPITSDFI